MVILSFGIQLESNGTKVPFGVCAHIIGGVHGKIGFVFVALIVWHSISCAGFFRLAIAK